MKAALVIAAALACTACAEETILAAHDDRPLDAGGDGDGDGDEGSNEPCRDDGDCDAQHFCDKDSCDAESGRCAAVEAECSGDAPPLCGCDGITYFNDCVRRQHAVSVASRGPCRDSARTCEGVERTPCDAPAYCVRMFMPMSMMDGTCDPDAAGQCWIMPARCSPDAHDGEGHFLCGDGPGGPGGGPEECLDLCNAIISGRPFVRVWDCDRSWSPP
jgi:hypothetical protein